MKKQGIGANLLAWSTDLNKSITFTISFTSMAMTWERLHLPREINLIILKLSSRPKSHRSARRRSDLLQLDTSSESLASRMTVSQKRRYLLLMIVYSRNKRSPSVQIARISSPRRAYLATMIRTIDDTWLPSRMTMIKSKITDAFSAKLTITGTLWIAIGMTLMLPSLPMPDLNTVRRLISVAMASWTISVGAHSWARHKRPTRIVWGHLRKNS